MHRQNCPTTKELEAFANGADRSGGLAEHIQDCPTCRQDLAACRNDAALIEELQAACRTTVDDRVRKRLLAVCRQEIKIARTES
jgi:hypothetical protein